MAGSTISRNVQEELSALAGADGFVGTDAELVDYQDYH